MTACKYCNFKNTNKCVINKIYKRFEDEEIDEEQMNYEVENAYLQCEDDYHDYQLDRFEEREGR